jgi:hypothetical protein
MVNIGQHLVVDLVVIEVMEVHLVAVVVAVVAAAVAVVVVAAGVAGAHKGLDFDLVEDKVIDHAVHFAEKIK